MLMSKVGSLVLTLFFSLTQNMHFCLGRLHVRSAAFLSRPVTRRIQNRCMQSSTTCSDEERIVADMLYRIRDTNKMPESVKSNLLRFRVDGIDVGKVTPSMARRLCDEAPNVFRLAVDASDKHLTLTDAAGDTCESRTQSVASAMELLRDENIITGWRNELYPISHGFYEPPVFLMERAAVPVLGGMEYGVHINGIVQDNGETKMVMARRAKNKSKYPGMLDHMVAGGQPVGLGLLDNVVKECQEEAGVPESLTRSGIQAAGAISYETYSQPKDMVSRAVLFCYDLHLPLDFEPKAVDGEVDEFFLWDMNQVKEAMLRDYHDPIKPNCYPVIIDYLLRQGHVSPETPGYLDVLRELRSGDCY